VIPRLIKGVMSMTPTRVLALFAALAGGAFLAAGCGSSPASVGVAQVAATTASTTSASPTPASKSNGPAAYSECMRSHGVPKFPDPDSQGHLMIRVGPGTGLDPNSPAFRAAQRTCQKLMPNGGKPTPAQTRQAMAAALKFSACMRSHGVTKFPDPKIQADGGMSLGFNRNSGIDPNSPQFQAAQRACQKLMPGGGKGGGFRTAGKP
jgi:hypothetical protein